MMKMTEIVKLDESRKQYELAKYQCKHGSLYREYWNNSLALEMFIAEVENCLVLCLMVVTLGAVRFEFIDLFKNPELFDVWDGKQYDLENLKWLIDSIALEYKVETCLAQA